MAGERISKFLKGNSRPNRVEQFNKLSENVTNKEELRELEMALLTPEPIPPYAGEERRYIVNSEHTVKFVFPNKASMDFFGRFIPIAEYKEKSVTNIQIILDLFRAIDNGEISYNKKTGEFLFLGEKDTAPETENNHTEPDEAKDEPTRRKLFRKRNS